MSTAVPQLVNLVVFAALTASFAPAVGDAHAAPPPQPGPGSPASPTLGPPGDPVAAGKAFDAGLTHDRNGDLTAACERFQTAAALAPSWGIARYQAAHCVRVLGDFAGAPQAIDPLAELTMAERLDVKRTPIYLEKARLLEDRGDRAGASQAYREALAAQSAEVRAQQGAARTADTEGSIKALERLQAYVAAQPGDAAGWFKLAQLAEAAKKYAIAEKAYDEMIALAHDKRRAIAALGAYGQRTRQQAVTDRALKAFRQLP